MAKKRNTKQPVIYQTKSGAIELRGDFNNETIWATQAQIADVFGVERSVVTKHIQNVLKVKEVDEKSNVQKMHTAHSDKPVAFYSLDVTLAVGYRVNSSRAIEFRKWSTKTIREHITKGYTINRKQITHNYDAFMKAVSDVQALLPEYVTLDPKQILEIIREFASTWVSLDAYDKDELRPVGTTKKSIEMNSSELTTAIAELRDELIKKGEAAELFAQEKERGSVVGIVGNIIVFRRKSALPKRGRKSGAPLVLYGEEPSFHRRQQALRRFFVCLVPA